VNQLIKITTNENDEQLVSARELHKALDIQKRFSAWWEQNSRMLIVGEDFTSVLSSTVVNNGAIRELQDYALTIDTAKHLAMQSQTKKGREVRDYFIKVEKAWNNPDMIIKRAMDLQARKIIMLETENQQLKPKALFAEAVETSKTSILVSELAKILKGNGVDIGQRRLFDWLRANGYLIKRIGSEWNMPTQKSMNLGLFEIKETTINKPDGHIQISKTSKVTGKGQIYFINKFKNEFSLEVSK